MYLSNFITEIKNEIENKFHCKADSQTIPDSNACTMGLNNVRESVIVGDFLLRVGDRKIYPFDDNFGNRAPQMVRIEVCLDHEQLKATLDNISANNLNNVILYINGLKYEDIRDILITESCQGLLGVFWINPRSWPILEVYSLRRTMKKLSKELKEKDSIIMKLTEERNL